MKPLIKVVNRASQDERDVAKQVGFTDILVIMEEITAPETLLTNNNRDNDKLF